MTTYTISELAKIASVTPRTIRYYVAEAVLPSPNKDGRTAVYGQVHLARLQLIKLLKDEYLPLHEIRSLLEGLDHQAVLDLLEEKQLEDKPSQPEASAKAYLKTLLNPSDAPSSPPPMMRHRAAQRKTEPLSKSPSEAKRLPPEDRLDAIGSAAKIEAEVATETGLEMSVAPVPEQHEALSPAPSPSLNQEEGMFSGIQKPEASVSQWQRYQISPDIELHVREDHDKPNLAGKIQHLIEMAQRLFENNKE
ncbi:MAG: MerR family transcriptional regulator [Chloroflexota bacterium]